MSTDDIISLKKASIYATDLGDNSSKDNCIKNLEKNEFEKTREQKLLHKKGKQKIIEPAIITLEGFDLDKIVALMNYLEDIIMRKDSNISLETHLKCLNQLSALQAIVKESVHTDCFLQEGLFFRNMGYTYAHEGNIGRLYSYLPSMSALSREVRFLLFDQYYKDVDMVNAHPSILAEFAYKKGLQTNYLFSLVKDRNTFYQRISEETNTNVSDAKKKVIITINLTQKQFYKNRFSETLAGLFKDIIIIRNAIYDNIDTNTKKFLKEKKMFTACDLEKKKVSVQSYYCQTKESEALIDLHEFLKKKDLDSDFKYSSSLPMIFIPFFDGAYVKYHNLSDQLRIPTFLEEYNSNTHFIKFVEKSITKEGSILCQETFNKYIIITKYVKSLSQKKGWKILTKLMLLTRLVTNDELDIIVKESSNLNQYNLQLTEVIRVLREDIRSADMSLEEKELSREKLNDLIEKRKLTYNYYLNEDIKSNIESKIKVNLYKLRNVMLEHAMSEKSLKTFIEEVLGDL